MQIEGNLATQIKQLQTFSDAKKGEAIFYRESNPSITPQQDNAYAKECEYTARQADKLIQRKSSQLDIQA